MTIDHGPRDLVSEEVERRVRDAENERKTKAKKRNRVLGAFAGGLTAVVAAGAVGFSMGGDNNITAKEPPVASSTETPSIAPSTSTGVSPGETVPNKYDNLTLDNFPFVDSEGKTVQGEKGIVASQEMRVADYPAENGQELLNALTDNMDFWTNCANTEQVRLTYGNYLSTTDPTLRGAEAVANDFCNPAMSNLSIDSSFSETMDGSALSATSYQKQVPGGDYTVSYRVNLDPKIGYQVSSETGKPYGKDQIAFAALVQRNDNDPTRPASAAPEIVKTNIAMVQRPSEIDGQPVWVVSQYEEIS